MLRDFSVANARITIFSHYLRRVKTNLIVHVDLLVFLSSFSKGHFKSHNLLNVILQLTFSAFSGCIWMKEATRSNGICRVHCLAL